MKIFCRQALLFGMLLILPLYCKGEGRELNPFLLQFDLKEEAFAPLLKTLLLKSQESIEGYLKNVKKESSDGKLVSTTGDIILGSDKKICTPEFIATLKNKDLTEVYTQCPGLPNSFLKRKEDRPKEYGWMGLLFSAKNILETPRPLQFRIGQFNVEDVSLGRPIVKCRSPYGSKSKTLSCSVTLSLHRLKASINIDLLSLYAIEEKGIEEGESLLKFNPLTIDIQEKKKNVPTVSLSFMIKPGSMRPIYLNKEETKISLPAGTISVAMGGRENETIGEILTKDHFSINKSLVSALLKIGSVFNHTSKDIYNILDFDRTINQVLSDPDKMESVEILLNKRMGLVDFFNAAIDDTTILKGGMPIFVPTRDIQDLMDFVVLNKIIDAYDSFLNRYVDGQESLIESFQYMGASFDELILKNFEATKNPFISYKIHQWGLRYSYILKKLKPGKVERERILDLKERLLKTEKRIEKNCQVDESNILTKSKLVFESQDQRYVLGLYDALYTKKAIPSVLGGKSDLELQVGLDMINQMIKTLYKNNKLNLCILKDPGTTPYICKSSDISQRVEFSVIKEGPVLSVDPLTKKLALDFDVKLTHNGVDEFIHYSAAMTIFFDKNNQIDFTYEGHSDESLENWEKHQKMFTELADVLIKYIFQMIPFSDELGLSEYSLEKTQKAIEESKTSRDEFVGTLKKVIPLKVVDFSVDEAGILVRANLEQE